MSEVKAIGHTITLTNAEGQEMFMNGLFVNVMVKGSALEREGITIQQFFDFLINRAADKGVTVSVKEIGEKNESGPSGFFS